MKDVVTVGAGVIGCTIASALRRQGRNVLLLDSGKPMAGSIPSGGHMRPEWFGKLPKEEYEPAMELLDQIWGIETVDFLFKDNGKQVSVSRVNMDLIKAYPRTYGSVTHVNTRSSKPSVTYRTKEAKLVVEAELLIVCAGVWSGELLKGLDVVGKQGISFRFQGQLDQPFIETWAPYKQVVAHQQSENEIWIGDGSAILAKNWTPERSQACFSRCSNTLPDKAYLDSLTGIRPYAKPINETDPCLMKQITPKIWVVTGAGKSGTISAGWAARRLSNANS